MARSATHRGPHLTTSSEGPLRQARERAGLTQAAAMRRFQRAVEGLGEHAPAETSLRRMFAYWERGERSVKVDAYRRAFMAVYGASAEELGFTHSRPAAEQALEPADLTDGTSLEDVRQGLDDALEDVGVSIARVEDWEQRALDYGRATRDRSPISLMSDLGDDLVRLRITMGKCHSALGLRRLTVVTAQLAGLMVLSLVKLDERAAFRRWASTARIAAMESDHPPTHSWVLAQEAFGHYYAGNLPAALTVARRAQYAAAGQACVGAPLAAALEARAAAAMGRGPETITALRLAEDLLGDLSADDQVASAFGYTQAQLIFHTSSAYTSLRNTKAAYAAQERALRLCAPGDYTDWAITRLDRATCHLLDHDVSEGFAEATDTLRDLTADRRRGIIDRRAMELLQLAPPGARRTSSLTDLQEMLSANTP
jgi:hypothetical protein